MTFIICYLCSANVPKEFAHEHHERPQAVGGTDLDIRFVCSGCHNNIHIIATMLRSSKAGNVEETIRSYSPYTNNVKAQKKCLHLAMEAAKWFDLKDSGDIKIDPDEEVTFEIKLPFKIKKLLQAEADVIKDPQTKRKVGYARLAQGIITEWVLRKYPKLNEK